MFAEFFEEEEKRISLLEIAEQEEQRLRLEKMRTTSGRWRVRREDWRDKASKFPEIRHHFWWIMHNSFAHLFLGFFPCKWTFKFHDWTSEKLSGKHLGKRREV